jgi:lysophospholipase L1-like esterase
MSEASAPGLSPWKRRLFWLVLVVVVLGASELIARLFLRVTRGYDGKHLYQYVYDPYKNILPTPNFVDLRGIRHNAEGFRRSTDTPRRKAPHTLRVFLMGASAAYGLGGQWPFIQRTYAVLKNSETIDAYLEGILHDAFPGYRVEVINAAITSTWTHNNLIYLNQSILSYDPDMILSLDGYNDFYFYEAGHDQFGDYAYSMPARRIMGDPTFSALVYADAWWLWRRSAAAYLVGRAGRMVKLMATPRPPRPPIDTLQAAAGFERDFAAGPLKMLRREGLIGRDENVDMVFMLQPMLILERGRRAAMPAIEQKLFDFNVSSYLPNYEAFITRAVGHVREVEPRMATDVGATFLDLTGIFQGAQGQIFTDYAHFTPRGNQIIAQYVAERIKPLLAARIRRLEASPRH